jgi:FkbM family methyltransferase
VIQENLIFDFGLHKGEDTDFYLRKGFDVVAFEADPDLTAYCAERFYAEIEQGRLRIIEGAITNEPNNGLVSFYKNTQNTVWGTTSPGWAERNKNKFGADSIRIDVKSIDVTDVFDRYGIPLYMKIDIEGADVHVLRALRNYSDRPHYLSMEAEKVNFEKLVAELDLLTDLGYRRFKAVQQETIPNSRIRTRTRTGQEFDYTFVSEASGPFGDDLERPWLRYEECLREYRRIFMSYRLFGDTSPIRRLRIGRHLLSTAVRLCNRPLPGWYDTHAAL